MSVSNATHVTLRNVDFNLNGNISCEVTTESPSFYTATATSVLQVVGEFKNEMKNSITFKRHYIWCCFHSRAYKYNWRKKEFFPRTSDDFLFDRKERILFFFRYIFLKHFCPGEFYLYCKNLILMFFLKVFSRRILLLAFNREQEVKFYLRWSKVDDKCFVHAIKAFK